MNSTKNTHLSKENSTKSCSSASYGRATPSSPLSSSSTSRKAGVSSSKAGTSGYSSQAVEIVNLSSRKTAVTADYYSEIAVNPSNASTAPDYYSQKPADNSSKTAVNLSEAVTADYSSKPAVSSSKAITAEYSFEAPGVGSASSSRSSLAPNDSNNKPVASISEDSQASWDEQAGVCIMAT